MSPFTHPSRSSLRSRRRRVVAAVRAGVAAAAFASLTCAVFPANADEITRQVQEELRKRNLYFGDVDGQATAQVAAALKRYQQRKGFAVTGEEDSETLRSLSLLPPPSPSGPGSDAEPGHGTGNDRLASQPNLASLIAATAPSPAWPDTTVLRSDQARQAPLAATAYRTDATGAPQGTGDPEGTAAADGAGALSPIEIDPTPSPHGSPIAAVTVGSQRLPTPDAVRQFVVRYLQIGQTNDPDSELRFYGDHVSYFDQGMVDRHFIAGDVNRYDHRWPERHFTLLEPVTFSATPDGDPAKFVVKFRYAFSVKNSRYTVQGKADNTWTLAGAAPGNWQIVSMREQRVREHK